MNSTVSISTNKISNTSFEWNLLFHILLGSACAMQPSIVPIWVAYIIIIEGTYKVYKSRNANGQAHLAAAYMAALEMVVRMSRSGLPHELTKYAVIFILINGLISKPRNIGFSAIFITYFLLQLPSIVMLVNASGLDRARQLASFNLAGPLCLTVASVYFYRLPISKIELTNIFKQLLLPISATATWLFVKTPNISKISFGFGANFEASGYGPNQMASVLGLGILLIGTALFFKLPIFKWKIIAYILLAAISYRCLLTFSRGGMASPLIILAILVIYQLIFDKRSTGKRFQVLIFACLFSFLAFGIYSYVNQKTGDALFNRYAGIKQGQKVDLEKYSSGRLAILRIDGEIFLDNPLLGIGPGMGTDIRPEYGYPERVAAHIEYSRLLAEHGIFGLLALGLLIGIPIYEFRRRKNFEQKFILIIGVLFCLSLMAHSATRIALPMFMYGLGFAWVYENHFKKNQLQISE